MVYSVKQFTLQRVIAMFEKNMKFPILLDIYGALLTDRKSELLDLYYNEDLSLSEISEITGISRQGVRDSVKKAEADLLDYEKKLGFAERSDKCDTLISEAKALAESLGKVSLEDDRGLSERILGLLDEIAAAH